LAAVRDDAPCDEGANCSGARAKGFSAAGTRARLLLLLLLLLLSRPLA
jgi:hypothetical protein